jgi:hypothetical protein
MAFGCEGVKLIIIGQKMSDLNNKQFGRIFIIFLAKNRIKNWAGGFTNTIIVITDGFWSILEYF